ncbi:MAG: hypothetical protein PHQ91_11550 [Thermoanaerobaculaceae bacterium]|nr:hypothetical protein [Thermoanaerobaculaceae bacterium]TAM45769.1 MAG: hypothetical protein EPN53_14515 [Acidobacteriota bacterium]
MELERILALADGPPKTAALAAWVQGLFPVESTPVLVGGAAVELYTGGAYVTGDLDFVGHVPAGVATKLAAAGFSRTGRHWLREPGQVFIEFPGETLGPGEESVRLRIGEVDVVTISPEDAVADRLGAWQHWRSMVDGVNAWLLFRAQRLVLDRARLRKRAAALEAEDALRALLALARRLGTREATEEELERWAQEGP